MEAEDKRGFSWNLKDTSPPSNQYSPNLLPQQPTTLSASLSIILVNFLTFANTAVTVYGKKKIKSARAAGIWLCAIEVVFTNARALPEVCYISTGKCQASQSSIVWYCTVWYNAAQISRTPKSACGGIG